MFLRPRVPRHAGVLLTWLEASGCGQWWALPSEILGCFQLSQRISFRGTVSVIENSRHLQYIYIYKYKLLWISILRLRYFQEISMGYIYIFSWDFRWVSPQFQLTLCQDSPPTDGIATSPSEVTNAWIPHCCISMIPPRKMNVAS